VQASTKRFHGTSEEIEFGSFPRTRRSAMKMANTRSLQITQTSAMAIRRSNGHSAITSNRKKVVVT